MNRSNEIGPVDSISDLISSVTGTVSRVLQTVEDLQDKSGSVSSLARRGTATLPVGNESCRNAASGKTGPTQGERAPVRSERLPNRATRLGRTPRTRVPMLVSTSAATIGAGVLTGLMSP